MGSALAGRWAEVEDCGEVAWGESGLHRIGARSTTIGSSDNITIIIPLMLATVLSTVLYRAVSPDSIYTLKLRRRGLTFTSGQDMDLMASTRVAAALTHRLLAVPPDMRIGDFRREVEREHHAWFPVVDGGVRWSVSSRRRMRTGPLNRARRTPPSRNT